MSEKNQLNHSDCVLFFSKIVDRCKTYTNLPQHGILRILEIKNPRSYAILVFHAGVTKMVENSILNLKRSGKEI